MEVDYEMSDNEIVDSILKQNSCIHEDTNRKFIVKKKMKSC